MRALFFFSVLASFHLFEKFRDAKDFPEVWVLKKFKFIEGHINLPNHMYTLLLTCRSFIFPYSLYVPCTSIIFNKVSMSSSACLFLYPFSSSPVSLNSLSSWGKSGDFRAEAKTLTFAQNVKIWWSATPIILQSLLKACLLRSCYYLHCGLQFIMNTRGTSYLHTAPNFWSFNDDKPKYRNWWKITEGFFQGQSGVESFALHVKGRCNLN
jgi:hypothetical protein